MNAATPHDIVNLVKKIGLATEEKRITWTPTSQESVFQARVAENFVQIEQSFDHDAEEFYYILTLRNDAGRLLDQISSGTFYGALQSLAPILGYPGDLEELYKSARWQALGVADVYRSILSNL